MLLYKSSTRKFNVGGGIGGYNKQVSNPIPNWLSPAPLTFGQPSFNLPKLPTGIEKPNTDFSKGISAPVKNTFSDSIANGGLLYSGAGDYSKKFEAKTAADARSLALPNLVDGGAKATKTNGVGDAAKYAGATTTGVGLISNAITANTYEGPKDPTKYTREDRRNDMKKSVGKGLTTGAAVGSTVGTLLGTAGTAAGSTAMSIGGLSAALTAGVAVPVIGAVVVGLGFALASFLSRKKKRRVAERNSREQIAGLNAQQMSQRRADLQTGADTSVNSPAPTVYGASQQGSYGVARRGGVLYKKKVPYVPAFKGGGKIKEHENIIPNGVLHEEDNSLGDKGMPVVKCVSNVCTKKYEIEKEELILTLDTTKKVEQLAKTKNHKALGEFVKEQLLDNTHSFSDKFSDLNNR